jgi:hypothetical protein
MKHLAQMFRFIPVLPDPTRDIGLVGCLTEREVFNGSTAIRAIKPKFPNVQIWCPDTNEYYGDPEPDRGVTAEDSDDGAAKFTWTSPGKRAPWIREDHASGIVRKLMRTTNKRWAFIYEMK